MRIQFIILFLLSLFFYASSFSQKYQSRHYTMKDGLPDNSVRSIFKDSKGYLWIGTDAGLCRFDGKKFKIFSSTDRFKGEKIWSITEDGSGNLWFGDYGNGVIKYDGNTFIKYNADSGLVNNRVRIIEYSKKFNLVLIGTDYGLTVYDGKTFHNFSKELGNAEDPLWVTGFYEDSISIKVYTFSHLNYTLDPNNLNLDKMGDNEPLYCGSYLATHFAKDGKQYFTDRIGLTILENNDTLKYITNAANTPNNRNLGQVFDITEDNDGMIWLASWEPYALSPGGLYMYDGEDVLKMNNTFNLDCRAGWSLYYDKDFDILWFGTVDNGLYRITKNLFEYYDPEMFGLDSLTINDLLFDKEGNLLILDKKHLIKKFNDETFEVLPNKPFYESARDYNKRIKNTNWSEIGKTKDYNSFLSALEFAKMTFDPSGNLWINSDPGLFKMNYYSMEPICHSMTGYGTRNIVFDGKGRLTAAASWGPMIVFEDIINSTAVLPLWKTKNLPKDISKVLAKDDKFWMTSLSKGLYCAMDTVYKNYNETNSEIDNSLNYLCLDNIGSLILGANNGNIYIADITTDSLNILHKIGPSDGISGNSINWLQADRRNQLWIGTNTWLNRLDLDQLYSNNTIQLYHYNEEEGYINQAGNVAMLDHNGDILVGTEGSLLRIKSSEGINKFKTKQHIRLLDFEINGKSFLQKLVSNLGLDEHAGITPCKLSYDQNYLVVRFDVLNYLNPDKDIFRYFLTGLDKEWSAFSDLRQVSYSHLPPGNYTLHIEGKNLNTGENYNQLIIPIKIKAPFWKTWWFYLLISSFIIIGVWIYFRFKIKKTKEEEQKKSEISRQLAELEMKALLAQMNPHFTFNAINSIQNYILDNDVDKALSYLSDFSKVVRQTLDNASKQFIPIGEEIEYLRRYLHLEQMRFDDQFLFEITVEEGIDPETALIPPMILQPFAENAIKHGLRHKNTQGNLSVRFYKADENTLKCSVEDDGIGREAAKGLNSGLENHRAAGTKITEQRIKQLNSYYNQSIYSVTIMDLSDGNGNPSGTKVIIMLPLQYG